MTIPNDQWVIKKSAFTRTMNPREAFDTLVGYRQMLDELTHRDIMMSNTKKVAIINEINAVSRFMCYLREEYCLTAYFDEEQTISDMINSKSLIR
jgi:hypothetical protein